MLDPAAVGADERVDLLVAVERQLAWLSALQQRVLASLEADPLRLGCDPDDDWTREQVAAALRLAAGTADRRLATARQLADRLPDTAAALAAGQITYLHAVRLVEAVKDLDDAAAAALQARVLPRAASQTVGQFAAAVQRAVLALDPRTAERRHADALERRRVAITPAEDGMCWLSAFLPAEGAALVGHVLDSLASVTGAGQQRSCDQRRADALVDVFARVLGDPSLPEQHGARPGVQVTVALSTLLGLDDQPAELAGYGPVTAASGPADGRRPDRHLAAAGHRPGHRRPARLRAHHLPAPAESRRLCHRPRPALCLPGVPAPRPPLRPGPRTALASRRTHQPRQPGRVVPAAPPGQTPRRLAPPPATRRQLPAGPPPPGTSTPSPRRSTRPTSESPVIEPLWSRARLQPFLAPRGSSAGGRTAWASG